MNGKIVTELCDTGVIEFDYYRTYHDVSGYDWVKSIVVFAFPYDKNKRVGSYLPARFAYGRDYHAVLRERLEKAARTYRLEPYRVLVDQNFLNEKLCAYLAGLGFIGRNTLLIHPIYGSYVVLGTIITGKTFSRYDRPRSLTCGDCRLCEDACPTGALKDGFNKQSCLSYLTQSSGNNFPAYEKLKSVFYGCDRCQEVCPYNKKSHTPYPGLNYNEDNIITLENMRGYSKQEFLKQYAHKNFQWVGYLKILRNIIVLDANNNNIRAESITFFKNKYRNIQWFRKHMEYLEEQKKHGP